MAKKSPAAGHSAIDQTRLAMGIGDVQMGAGQIMVEIIFLTLAIGAFVISYLQFKEKGFLFNNAYIWASQEERKQMDKDKESKRSYYRQSGFTFAQIGIIFLIFAVYLVADWIWMYVAFWVSVIIAVAYAVVSSIKIERQNKAKKQDKV